MGKPCLARGFLLTGESMRSIKNPASSGTEGESETVSVKGGSSGKPVDLGAAIHIWTTRKLPGVIIPDGNIQLSTAVARLPA